MLRSIGSGFSGIELYVKVLKWNQTYWKRETLSPMQILFQVLRKYASVGAIYYNNFFFNVPFDMIPFNGWFYIAVTTTTINSNTTMTTEMLPISRKIAFANSWNIKIVCAHLPVISAQKENVFAKHSVRQHIIIDSIEYWIVVYCIVILLDNIPGSLSGSHIPADWILQAG